MLKHAISLASDNLGESVFMRQKSPCFAYFDDDRKGNICRDRLAKYFPMAHLSVGELHRGGEGLILIHGGFWLWPEWGHLNGGRSQIDSWFAAEAPQVHKTPTASKGKALTGCGEVYTGEHIPFCVDLHIHKQSCKPEAFQLRVGRLYTVWMHQERAIL